MALEPAFWRRKRVLVTGHTGFKGGWLTLFLRELGAEVTGYALAPDQEPSLFDVTQVDAGIRSKISDIRDAERLRASVAHAKPAVVFHLAAQALVRKSYTEPLGTIAVNVLGTANLLEAIRRAEQQPAAVVVITTDKCYENREWPWAYRETDALGGRDIYSASKAAAELLTSAYARSFLQKLKIPVATVRAGNVIGGGDWATDRLLPDLVRAVAARQPAAIRNPKAIRPWQHVLECSYGYLLLAEALARDGEAFAEPWNFGPAFDNAKPVEWVADYFCRQWPGHPGWRHCGDARFAEAGLLRLDSAKASARLGWRCRLDLAQALDWTLEWYRAHAAGEPLRPLSAVQIRRYLEFAAAPSSAQ